MSLNTAHANNGVLIHSGEAILLFSENVTIEFSGQDGQAFRGTKQGSIYLTTHRMIFNAKRFEDMMKSFSFPFVCLNEVEVEQPMFGPNYIRGKVRAQPDGNFIGEAKFKLIFKAGGAIEFAQAMLRAAHMAQQNAHGAEPPPYSPPMGDWHPVPPPAYTPTPGHYGWLPLSVFPNMPNANTVYMHDSPPPYPGINPGTIPNNPPPSYGYPSAGGYPPQYPNISNGAPYSNPAPNYPQGGFQQPYQQQSASNPTYYPQPGYPSAGGYPPQYPNISNAAPYSNPAPNYPQEGFQQPYQQPHQQPPSAYPGYAPSHGGAGGFAPPPNSKEAEAMQSSSNPSQPSAPYAPPPGYNDLPPSYNSVHVKKD